MSEALRRAIRGNPLCYLLYIRLSGKYMEDIFPGPSTQLHLTGYPRSANTFASKLVSKIYPNLKIASHGHSVATLKVARKKGIKTVVLIREPLEAISSRVVQGLSGKRGGTATMQVRKQLEDYVCYYTYVERHGRDFRMLDFKTVTKTPERLIELILELGVVDENRSESASSRAHEVIAELRDHDTRPPERSQLSNPQKERRKSEVKEILLLEAMFPQAMALYKSLSPIAVTGRAPARREGHWL